jgi:hypothetical protein
MLPPRIFETQIWRPGALAPAKRQLDPSGDATLRTSEILSMPRHWLTTRKAPGVLLRLFLAAFGY